MSNFVKANVDMQGALANLERLFSKPGREVTVIATVKDSNGWHTDENGERVSLATGTTDWNKQERLHRMVGTANAQFVSQSTGMAVAGAGKGQKDKK